MAHRTSRQPLPIGDRIAEFPDSNEQDDAGLSDASSPLLTVAEAAEYLRASKNYLDKLRVAGNGPRFVRFGRRKVVYHKSDLDAWIEQRIYASTSEYLR